MKGGSCCCPEKRKDPRGAHHDEIGPVAGGFAQDKRRAAVRLAVGQAGEHRICAVGSAQRDDGTAKAAAGHPCAAFRADQGAEFGGQRVDPRHGDGEVIAHRLVRSGHQLAHRHQIACRQRLCCSQHAFVLGHHMACACQRQRVEPGAFEHGQIRIAQGCHAHRCCRRLALRAALVVGAFDQPALDT